MAETSLRKNTAGPVRLGKIGYLNMLPIYYALESGVIDHPFTIVSGPPAELNKRFASGELDLSSVSSIEYGRNSGQYCLLPDLAIGSRGPVKSVLLLSRVPVEELGGRTILVSSETHTSAALLKILFRFHLPLDVRYATGDAAQCLRDGSCPSALLAIGDQALCLRNRTEFPHVWDLGQAWQDWTGLPFIFGVWAARREFLDTQPRARELCLKLLQAKEWGQAHRDVILDRACEGRILSRPDMEEYFNGLVYDLGEREIEGLTRFYQYLNRFGEIEEPPELAFI